MKNSEAEPKWFSGMEKLLKSNLSALVTEYTSVDPTKRSVLAHRATGGNHKFFDKIETDEGFTIKIYDRVVQWFSTYWPEGAAWPEQVERPKPGVPYDDLPDEEDTLIAKRSRRPIKRRQANA